MYHCCCCCCCCCYCCCCCCYVVVVVARFEESYEFPAALLFKAAPGMYHCIRQARYTCHVVSPGGAPLDVCTYNYPGRDVDAMWT